MCLPRASSAPIPHAGGRFKPKPPPPILAGVVSLDTRWSPRHGRAFREVFSTMKPEARLDLGCVLNDRAFAVEYSRKGPPTIHTSKPETALIFFFVHLLSRLQAMGTVPAGDFGKYGRVL